MEAFTLVLTASDVVRLTCISTFPVNTISLKSRLLIVGYCEARLPYQGEVKLDDSASDQKGFGVSVSGVLA